MMHSKELQEHVFSTYKSIRYGLALIAFSAPILLYLGGRFYGIELQNSLSAYYWASSEGHQAPMRDWFVGVVFALGALSILYKGFSRLENWLLNLVGCCAIGVAIFPMAWGDEPIEVMNLHNGFAVLMFLGMAYVSFRCTDKSLALLKNPKLKNYYRTQYRIIAVFMLISPVVALSIVAWTQDIDKFIYAVETFGIWTFAYYWWVKSRELMHSDAEMKALKLKASAKA